MKKIALLLTALFMTSCTYNVAMVHTEGHANDVIDETSANTPTVTPTVSIPLTKA